LLESENREQEVNTQTHRNISQSEEILRNRPLSPSLKNPKKVQKAVPRPKPYKINGFNLRTAPKKSIQTPQNFDPPLFIS
jgi:DNA-binding protein H-NS